MTTPPPAIIPVDPLTMTLPQAAKLIGMSPFTVRRWVAAGRIPKIEGDRRLRFSRAALEEWAKSNLVGG